jgi:hypothetical protein
MNRNSFRPQAPQFQFITVQSLEQATDAASRRLVRSHALKETLKAKRKKAEGLQENFRFIVPQDSHKLVYQPRNRDGVEGLPATIAADRLDPFDSLAADSSRLHIFLRHGKYTFHPDS